MYGLKAQGPSGRGPAQKPTRFMPNSPCIASQLKRRCPNRMTHTKKKHEHVPLMNGRARAAQTYPNALCRAICRGIVQQIQADRQGQFIIATLAMCSAAGASSMSGELLGQVKLAECV